MTTNLTPDAFTDFFRGVADAEPFPWQSELVRHLIDGRIPDVIDVPTGLGKTSVILCWAYALAVQAQSGKLSLPRRLCFVVDRRLVVDGAFQEAERLKQALARAAGASTSTAAAAAALRSLHDDASEPPLEIVKMRGGTTWESRWLARPDQAAVVVGTVDQFGSRLLFRGYGVSERMRPINAALVGLDSWLVLDEAHIAEPLAQTAASVTKHQELTEAGSGLGLPCLRYTLMSATVKPGDGLAVFHPDPEVQARASEAARLRLSASKPVALVELKALANVSKGRWREQASQLGEKLADLAIEVDPDACVVGVVANTIASARAAYESLRARGGETMLLIGRVRGYERDRIFDRWIPRIAAGEDIERTAQRLYVVATQTIEVGANVDFDALVTECAPLAALIQRFGRVNRLGLRQPYRSYIVHAGFAHEDDRIYGSATGETWRYLGGRATPVPVAKQSDQTALSSAQTIDFGLRAARRFEDEAPDGVRETSPFIPIALGAHFERWAATSPMPVPDQTVAPFLHGVDRDVPEVSIAWRAAPPDGVDGAVTSQEWLELVPPVEWEYVDVPIWEARALLAGVAAEAPMADIEGALTPEDLGTAETSEPGSNGVLGVVYRGRGEQPKTIRGPRDICVGDHIVLDAWVGGHDEWGWSGRRAAANDRPVPDVGDLAPTRRRSVLRLSRSVLQTLLPEDRHGALEGALALIEPDDLWGSVARALDALAQAAPPDKELAQLFADARGWTVRETEIEDAGHRVVLLSEDARSRQGGDAQSDEDVASTSQTGAPTTLNRHGEDVGAVARQFAEHLGLPEALVRALELAGRWHDLGKADPRFQVMLHNGDELAAFTAAEPLAKSGRSSRDPVARLAHRVAGLPSGYRHEAASARLFDDLREKAPLLLDGVDAELVRHLIVSHHGSARPLLPPLLDAAAPSIEMTVEGIRLAVEGNERQVDWTQPPRFEALCARYGWWGLAYLEAIVRLADMLCSERGPSGSGVGAAGGGAG